MSKESVSDAFGWMVEKTMLRWQKDAVKSIELGIGISAAGKQGGKRLRLIKIVV